MKVLVRISFISILCIVMLAGGMIMWFYSGFGLPDLSSLDEYKSAQNSKVLASDGTLLTELQGDENREIVSIENIPDHMQQAVIAIEDVDFYRHKGINWKRVLGALWANVVEGEVVQGGSTITMQYVKNAYVGTERTLWRKMQEAYLAYQLEQKYSKQKIMELYLNDVYFGQRCYGVYTAAKKYFGKLPQQLTLAESATLAGFIRSPSYYDPYTKPQEVIERRNLVLRQMDKSGFITAEEAEAAKNEPLNVVAPTETQVPKRAPFFCDYITRKVRQDFGDQKVFRGGLRIYTTIDMHLQELAEQVIQKNLSGKPYDASLCCVDPRTGYIKAMVGGKDYNASQFNSAADGYRQPGSSFKVFVLMRALSDGISPNDTYSTASPMTFEEIKLPDGRPWTVRNFGGGGGQSTIANATVRSINVVYAQMILDVGVERVASLVESFGISRSQLGTDEDGDGEIEIYPAIALGGLYLGVTPLQMASAYGVLANNGNYAIPRSYYKVTDSQGNVVNGPGDEPADYQPQTEQILSSKNVQKMNEILKKVVSGGTGTAAKIGRPQAGKTGTTEEHADAWFVGYTPELVTAVWVGYPQGRISMGGMCGGDLPASIWRQFMGKALEDVPITAFAGEEENTVESSSRTSQEQDVVTVLICDDSGLLATANCPHTHYQTFPRGQEPTAYCDLHQDQQTATVPSVVGMSESQAASTLQGAGYVVSVVDQPSNKPQGTVLGQTPSAGTTYSKGRTVTITVSSGAAKKTVPNVLGMQQAAAVARISSAGFVANVNYAEGGQEGTVIGQSPSAGTQLPVGSVVTITVAKAAQQGLGSTLSRIGGYFLALDTL